MTRHKRWGSAKAQRTAEGTIVPNNEVDTGSSERLTPMTIVDLYVWYVVAAVNGGAEAEEKAREFARRLSAEDLKVAADALATKRIG